jgi:hypothetical protein
MGTDEIIEKEIQDVVSTFGYTRKQAIEYLITIAEVQGFRDGITKSQEKEILTKLKKEKQNGGF